MKLLAIDTATEACSAALLLDGEITLRHEIAPRRHAELILPMVDDLLNAADIRLVQLDALAFGRGPGAFTGLRIAAGVIQGLAYAASLPVVPVSTLAALAQAICQPGELQLSAIDARMGEVYWGLFRTGDDGLVKAVSEEQVCIPEMIRIGQEVSFAGTGSGWQTYAQILAEQHGKAVLRTHPDRFPSAQEVAILGAAGHLAGRSVEASGAVPVYLRNQVTG